MKLGGDEIEHDKTDDNFQDVCQECRNQWK